MQISFGKTLELNAALDNVMKFLNDLHSIAACIPDSDGFKQVDDRNCTMNVKVGLAFIRGSFVIKCGIAENRPERFVYRIEGSGIGSTVRVTLSLSPAEYQNRKTKIMWTANAELSGLVSGVSETVIRKVTEDKINEIVANVKIKVEKGV